MSTEFERAVEAMRAAGFEVQIERNGVGQLLLTLKGEAVDDWRDDDGPWVTVVAHESSEAETITPTELAVQLWGSSEGHSRAPGPRRIRVIARRLFPGDAPGQGGDWHLTSAQVAAIKRGLGMG